MNGYSYLTTMNGANYPRAIVNLLAGKDTAFSFRSRQQKKNFILGFRETLVDEWIA